MPRTLLIISLACTLFVTCFAMIGFSNDAPIMPRPESPSDRTAKRETIHIELDANQRNAQSLFELMDQLGPKAKAEKQFLENQIQAFDVRSEILFEELDHLDQMRYQAERLEDLQLKLKRLEQNAAIFAKNGHKKEAADRRDRAAKLKMHLNDGTWKIFTEEEWSCRGSSSISPKDDLETEILRLRDETNQLRNQSKLQQAEIAALRHALLKVTNGQQGKNTNRRGKGISEWKNPTLPLALPLQKVPGINAE